MSEKFSVLMSVYYKELPEYLICSLNSVFQQTVPPNEVVIVEDGPLTKQLYEVLDEYAKQYSNLKRIPLSENHGLGYALNVGLLSCTHELVARMDTDDISLPNRFEKQVFFLQLHPMIDIVGSYATKIDECGNNLEEVIKVPVTHEDIVRLVWTCPMNHPTVMYRKKAILSVGGYKPDAGPRQDDYDLWFRCAEKGLHFANISEPLLLYRFFADSVRKNNIEVGRYRMKTGLRGCRKLHLSFIAYIGVCIPFVRSLLPYPLNTYFQELMNRMNPRNK